MDAVSAYEAKTHLSALIERASSGESVVITRHGRPVARLVPFQEQRPVDDVIHALREVRNGVRLGEDLSARALVEEGRRR